MEDKGRNLPLVTDAAIVLNPTCIFSRGKNKSRNLPLITELLRERKEQEISLVLSATTYFFSRR